jgi:PP-loop superfamily ATP-utilizing enzyme
LETAQHYYSGVPEKVRRAEKLVTQLGIAFEQIEANAMHLRNPGLQTLDRMITCRETLRNRIVKEYERRKRKADKAKRRTAINDNAPAATRPARP